MAAYRPVHDMHVCVSLWAWWEVVAAYHRVHDHACCHLQTDCLESGISSGALRSTMSMGTFTFTFSYSQDGKYPNDGLYVIEQHTGY